jgi:hypothetical protein
MKSVQATSTPVYDLRMRRLGTLDAPYCTNIRTRWWSAGTGEDGDPRGDPIVR